MVDNLPSFSVRIFANQSVVGMYADAGDFERKNSSLYQSINERTQGVKQLSETLRMNGFSFLEMTTNVHGK